MSYCRCTGTTQIHNYTKNRRAGDSPFLTPGDIDPNAAVIAINDMEGHPLATGKFETQLLCPRYLIGTNMQEIIS